MRKRVLFVENDPVLLQIYAKVLEDEPDRWEVMAVTDGWRAFELMEQSAFDVVVSALRLPGISGVELMKEVRKRYPGASRVILSEISDQEEVARCLNSIHQFLAKPFEVNALKATLTRLGSLDRYLQDEKLKTLVTQLGTLPSLPTLYLKIMRELGAEDPSIESIAGIIADDPGMTARILQIANSAVLGLARKISSPSDAVQYLGFGTVRSLVLSAHIFACFDQAKLKGFSVNQLWNHSLGTGSLARSIMQLEGAEAGDADDAYTAGMLHDVGKLLLANSLPEQFQRALTLAAERGIPLHEAEAEVFGATHAGAAAYLLGLWGLPASIVEAIAFHHQPNRSDMRLFGPLTAVHVANPLEQEFSKAKPCGRRSELDVEYLASIDLRNRLEEWRAEAKGLR
jgi:HD-like signal output (HDOD) protein